MIFDGLTDIVVYRAIENPEKGENVYFGSAENNCKKDGINTIWASPLKTTKQTNKQKNMWVVPFYRSMF